MAEPSVKPKKAAPAYEMVENETGALRRVPMGTARPKPSFVTAAVAASAAPRFESPPAEEVEEELVFNETGEVTGNARAAAIAEADARLKAQEEEELVFNETGEVTGEARAAAQAAARPPPPPPKSAKPERKPKAAKAADTFQTSNSEDKIKLFYFYRSKFPQYFVYTAEGNLEIKPNPKDIPPGVIPLRAFGPLKSEELEEIERNQRDKQLEIEGQYVLKLKELRQANDMYDTMNPESSSTIVRLNEELRELSVLRNTNLYPERWTKTLESVDTRRILLNQPNEERKLGYPVFLFKRYSLSRADAEGHYREHGETNTTGMAGGGTVVLFITDTEDPNTGPFHPTTEREFVYNETRYSSPYQAFETERFKELDDEKMVKQLLGTRSAKTIKTLVSKEPRQPQHPLMLWESILEAFYTQFKDAMENLKATGSARFHMMDKQMATPEYANALANVRTKLKERENDAPGGIDQIKNSVITEGEQKKAKVGAIIHNFRRG